MSSAAISGWVGWLAGPVWHCPRLAAGNSKAGGAGARSERQAVAAEGAHAVVLVGVALYDARVRVVRGAVVAVRALAQRVGVHLVQQLLPLPRGEQSARLLALAP